MTVRYAQREVTRERVRAAATSNVTVAQTLLLPIYKVPIGYRFAVRRISFDTGNITQDGANLSTDYQPLNSGGQWLRYYRSGTPIEWASPKVAGNLGGAAGSVPGVQTWGDEEGPQLISGEVFEVAGVLAFLFPGVSVTAQLEGILTKIGSPK